jgi:putative endonuclease
VTGERLAAQFLADQGYRLLDRNWRFGREGEIDLVAVDGECLVIVEVRTRRGSAFGTPEESVTGRKQARLAALTQAYVAEQDWSGPVRIDVVGVHLSQQGHLLDINHLQDVVSG